MNESLHYLIRQPKKQQESPPLLVLLHGYGSNELDLYSFAKELPDDLLIISTRAPYEIGFESYAWYNINFDQGEKKFSDINQAKKSLDKIAVFIDELKLKYNCKKTFLLGFSQGATLSYALSFSHPNKVDYVIALSGFLVDDLLPKEMNSKITTDFYVSHGSEDQVIPVEWARKVAPFLDSLNINNQYSEYPAGHGVAPQNFFSFKKWIEERL